MWIVTVYVNVEQFRYLILITLTDIMKIAEKVQFGLENVNLKISSLIWKREFKYNIRRQVTRHEFEAN